MDDALVERARRLTTEHLASRPRRLAHVEGVAETATMVVAACGSGHAEEVVAAAWLHDIGYGPSIRRTGFHPIDGAEFVRDEGFPALVVSLVAYHSGAVVEAEERGLSDRLASIEQPPEDLLDEVTFADMTTGPDGRTVTVDARLAEILKRYEDTDAVHRAISRSGPGLLAAVARVRERIDAD